MKADYFIEELDTPDVLSAPSDDHEVFEKPEHAWRQVRERMEDLAYRTAILYGVNGKASSLYQMTIHGIKVRGIENEDYQRNDELGELPVSSQESRLLG